jgi:hypothetical protein
MNADFRFSGRNALYREQAACSYSFLVSSSSSLSNRPVREHVEERTKADQRRVNLDWLCN